MVERYQQGKPSDLSIRALWQSYQQLSSSKVGGMVKEMMNFALRSISFILTGLYHALKSYMGPTTLLSLRRKAAADFYRLYK
jgi:hypothetical protein